MIDRLIASIGIKDWSLGPQRERELGFWVKAEITENGKWNRICLVYLMNSYGGEERRSLSWTTGAGCRRQWKVVCFACSERVLFSTTNSTTSGGEESNNATSHCFIFAFVFIFSALRKCSCADADRGPWVIRQPNLTFYLLVNLYLFWSWSPCVLEP